MLPAWPPGGPDSQPAVEATARYFSALEFWVEHGDTARELNVNPITLLDRALTAERFDPTPELRRPSLRICNCEICS